MRHSAQSGFSPLYIVIVVCFLLAFGGIGFYLFTRGRSVDKIDKYVDIENRGLIRLSPPASSKKVINPEEDIPIYYKP